MKTIRSFLFVSPILSVVLALAGCGSSSSPSTVSSPGVVAYASGEIAPVNGVCPAGTIAEPDGGCGTYGGTASTTSPNCSLYSSANGCCPTSFTLSGGVCTSSSLSCISGTTVTSTYGCQPSTMPVGCSWSAMYNGCVGVGTPSYTSYPGWSYYPTGSNQYVWYYTAGAPQSGCFWTGYGWACSPYAESGYVWNGYGWVYVYL